MREPRDWANLGELVFGVEHHARNVRWLRGSTPGEGVLLASAKRQQELSLQFQGQAKALAENLGERYSLRWLAARLHTLNYDGAYAVLRGRTRMNLEHIEDFTQAVSQGGDTVSTVVDGPTT